MSDDTKLLHLAEVLKAVVDLQITQSKATAVLVSQMKLQHEVAQAQSLAGDAESQLLRSLREQVDSIILSLKARQGSPKQ